MNESSGGSPAYVITGPTSGIGRGVALRVAERAPVILVGRQPARLEAVQREIRSRGGQAAATVVCDLADLESVRAAARAILALGVPLAGLLNNAGILRTSADAGQSAQGLDLTFATNCLGPLLLAELLGPGLPDGANVVSVCSAIEDPLRKPAKVMGMRGGRYISAQASARGQWQAGGAQMPGIDAYATSKQALLAATFALARENRRLRFNAVEPGITPGTGLGGANAFVAFLFGQVITRLPPFARYRSTVEDSARVIANILTKDDGATGVYTDEKGAPMNASERARQPDFQDRVLAETRALLRTLAPEPR